MLSVEITGDNIVITVSKEYLASSSESAWTTGGEKTVTDKEEMTRYFANKLSDINDDSDFNHCLDRISETALEDGENWIELDSQQQGNYQCKEIGESDWEDCTLDRYKYCGLSPEHDTRILTA